MNDAARKARNEYQREWRKRNPDKVRATRERYWERKAAEQQREAKQDGKSD